MIITIDLIEDSIDGLIEVEITGVNGFVLSGPRKNKMFTQKLESVRGVYFLIDDYLEKPLGNGEERQKMYIGKSDDVSDRLSQHKNSKNKEFWKRTCVICCNAFNHDEIGYLEKKLIEVAGKCKYIELVNEQKKPPKKIPKSNIDNFIKHIHLIFPMLGYNFLREEFSQVSPLESQKKPSSAIALPTTKQKTGQFFVLHDRKQNIKAKAQYDDNGKFIILKNSEISKNWMTNSKSKAYKSLRSLLVNDELISIPKGKDKVALKIDLPFDNQSLAASVVLGRPSNGEEWKIEDEKYL